MQHTVTQESYSNSPTEARGFSDAHLCKELFLRDTGEGYWEDRARRGRTGSQLEMPALTHLEVLWGAGHGLESSPGGEGKPREGVRRPEAGLGEDHEGSDLTVKAKTSWIQQLTRHL